MRKWGHPQLAVCPRFPWQNQMCVPDLHLLQTHTHTHPTLPHTPTPHTPLHPTDLHTHTNNPHPPPHTTHTTHNPQTHTHTPHISHFHPTLSIPTVPHTHTQTTNTTHHPSTITPPTHAFTPHHINSFVYSIPHSITEPNKLPECNQHVQTDKCITREPKIH